MKLFEHPEFDQAMLRAASRFDLSEQFVEKDYYVTEILRIIAAELGDRAVFKGGTSLSTTAARSLRSCSPCTAT
jgi:predicted nucleotidyltransferase component of viral defense system